MSVPGNDNDTPLAFEPAVLARYLSGRIAGFDGPLEIKRFQGGQSNPTYLLTTPARRFVLRSKPGPVSQLLPSAHAVEREFRVQAALADSAVPVARMHCLCEDESVIGRAFYVMDYLEGRIFWDSSLPGLRPCERAAIYDELNRVIAELHKIDIGAVNLSDYGRAGNYFERQINRWTRQYRASEMEPIEAMSRLIAWLPEHIPHEEQPQIALVHGDYRLDNVIFHPTEPRILAVIDWELSTLGHPLADFAYHLMSWHVTPQLARGLKGVDLQTLGIPGEAQYIRAYERRVGHPVAAPWSYYLAYNLFRIAAIVQGIAKRAADGIASNAQAAAVGLTARPLAELGWTIAQQLRSPPSSRAAIQSSAQESAMSVKYETRDGIAIITLENPPINGLGLATRRGLVESLARASDDVGIAAIVVTGGARAFSGGADISEFNTPQALREPTLPAVIAAFERSAKPVVAAIEGMALGGGLELALAMSHRVADRRAQIGLPEVKLGLLPGAGGTQRFPRAAGLETAVNMIVSGTAVPAGKLSDGRLFDRVVDGDVVAAAVELARDKAAAGGALPRVRDLKVEHPQAEAFLGFAHTAVAAASANYPAPLKCLDAIEAAVKQPFEEGLRAEREAFALLVQTPESKALRHGFFSERAAGKVADLGPGVPMREIRRIGVIGAGTMGGGITMNVANAGLPVTLVEATQEALDRGLANIRKIYEGSARKGKLDAGQVVQRLGLITPTLSYDGVKDADLIIEAVFEEYSVKEGVLGRLGKIARPGAIIASNTSTLDVNRLAGVTGRPQDVLGMHFFSPAHVMKLLEVVRGRETAKDVLATVMSLAKRIGKVAVVSGVCDGFIGNRMIEQYSRQAGFLLDEGALPQQVDRAAEKFGFAMGPFRMGDLAGNDIGRAIRKRRAVEHPEITYPRIADQVCDLGRYGQKTGKGWYDYEPGDRTARPSPEVNALIERHSKELGVTRRKIDDEEIVERLVYALINEGARILEDGIAAKASDIDVVYLTGYGFPAWRGGPMFYADSVGLSNVLGAMRRYAKGYQGAAWQPAPLLVRLAEAGQPFNG